MLGDPTNSKNPDAGKGLVVRESVRGSVNRISPLLHRHLDLSMPEKVFESRLDLEEFVYLGDHRFGKRALMPASGYAELLLAASHQIGPDPVEAEVRVLEPMHLDPDQPRTVQVTLSRREGGTFRAYISSKTDEEKHWTLHSKSTLFPHAEDQRPGVGSHWEIAQRCGDKIPVETLYKAMKEMGYHYGPAFQGVVEMRIGEDEILARVEIPKHISARDYRIHPVLLDACLHAAKPLLPASGNWLPLGMERFRFYGVPERTVWVHLTKAKLEDEDMRGVDLKIFEEERGLLAEVEGLLLKRIDSDLALVNRDQVESSMFELEWQEADKGRILDPAAKDTLWLIIGDMGGVSTSLINQRTSASMLLFPPGGEDRGERLHGLLEGLANCPRPARGLQRRPGPGPGHGRRRPPERTTDPVSRGADPGGGPGSIQSLAGDPSMAGHQRRRLRLRRAAERQPGRPVGPGPRDHARTLRVQGQTAGSTRPRQLDPGPPDLRGSGRAGRRIPVGPRGR